MVSRRVFAVFALLLVVMMGASDVAIVLIAPNGPTAADVRSDIQDELNRRATARDHQTCSILATLPHTKRSDQVRHKLRCYRALHPKPSPRPAPSPSLVVIPSPGPTTTTTRTVTRPAPGKPPATVTVTPSCRGVKVQPRQGGCLPTHIPAPPPSLHLR